MKQSGVSSQPVKVVKLGGRRIGWFEGDTFIKPVLASKHQLQKPSAWCIDADIFDREVKPFARWFVVWEQEHNTRYRISVEQFDLKKGALDRGFGRQYFCALSNWEIVEQPPLGLSMF